MSRIRITKEFGFEMAHALKGHNGPCRFIHGHSYVLSVTILGKPLKQSGSPANGMVMDFSELKQIVYNNIICHFDHALVLNRETELEEIGKSPDLFDKLILVDYQPTSENLLLDFADRMMKKLPDTVSLAYMKLRETASSYAEWFASDNQFDRQE